MINHGAHGYAKFVLDDLTINALTTGLNQLKSSFDRKHIYNILYDMTISGRIPGSLVLSIILKNVNPGESEDVLKEVLTSITPSILKKYIPLDKKD